MSGYDLNDVAPDIEALHKKLMVKGAPHLIIAAHPVSGHSVRAIYGDDEKVVILSREITKTILAEISANLNKGEEQNG